MRRIDLGDPGTWSDDMTTLVAELSERIQAHPNFRAGMATLDIRLETADATFEEEPHLRQILEYAEVVMYHGTCLLPHEMVWVRTEGLQPLDHGLRRRRLNAAAANHPDVLDADGVDLLVRNGPLSWGGHGMRLGQIWGGRATAVVR